MFGGLLALVGWTGLNSAGAILFTGAEPGSVALIAVNTMLAAAGAALAAAVITRLRFGKPDASLSANGWVSGLAETQDRKSTRLNSSHRTISYAVFCLKKKKKKR